MLRLRTWWGICVADFAGSNDSMEMYPANLPHILWNLGKHFWSIEYYTRRMTTCYSGYAQMHYFQIQLLISTERPTPPQADLSVDCSGYYFRPFKLSLMAKKYIWICDLQPCLILPSLRCNCYLLPAPPLSSQHSLALRISSKAVLAFSQNGQNI